MRCRESIFVVLVVAALGACSSSSSGGGGTSGLPARSTTCLAWQKAECDHAVDQCSQGTRGACDDTFQSLFCKSDSVIQACIDALPSAGCTTAPPACQGVADPQPAVDYCKKFIDTVCNRAVECGQGTKQDCVSGAQSSVDCSQAVGVGPTADACLNDARALACDASGLPGSCQGVVKMANATTGLAPTRGPSGLSVLLSGATAVSGYGALTK